MDQADLEITLPAHEIWRLMDLEFSSLRGGELKEYGWMLRKDGTEDRGDTAPGLDFGHDAYARLRRLAWKFRNCRDGMQSVHLEVGMGVIAGWVKERQGVNPAHVDRVVECLTVKQCGCERCRYGV
jgi:hypothetical protein